MIKKIYLFILLIGVFYYSTQAQNIVNYSGYKDTCNINTFRADSFKLTKAFDFTQNENKELKFIFDDSLHSGRANDSVAAEIGYELGSPTMSTTGVYCTTWTSPIVLDTINTLTAGKRYDPDKYVAATAWPLDRTTELNVRPKGMIDTTLGSASSCISLPIIPFWRPLVRFYVKGLTGNCNTFIICRFDFTQRKFSSVRNQ